MTYGQGVPTELGGAKVIRYAKVSENVRPTGATRHVVGGEEMSPFSALAVARYADTPGYYLFYLDSTDTEITDGWHETLDEALEQAEFEYEGISDEWIEVAPD